MLWLFFVWFSFGVLVLFVQLFAGLHQLVEARLKVTLSEGGDSVITTPGYVSEQRWRLGYWLVFNLLYFSTCLFIAGLQMYISLAASLEEKWMHVFFSAITVIVLALNRLALADPKMTGMRQVVLAALLGLQPVIGVAAALQHHNP